MIDDLERQGLIKKLPVDRKKVDDTGKRPRHWSGDFPDEPCTKIFYQTLTEKI
jgi:hypothetical protein